MNSGVSGSKGGPNGSSSNPLIESIRRVEKVFLGPIPYTLSKDHFIKLRIIRALAPFLCSMTGTIFNPITGECDSHHLTLPSDPPYYTTISHSSHPGRRDASRPFFPPQVPNPYGFVKNQLNSHLHPLHPHVARSSIVSLEHNIDTPTSSPVSLLLPSH